MVRRSVIAMFKIIATRPGPRVHSIDFQITPISGQLAVGDVFFCFDLHHPIEFVVEHIQDSGGQTHVFCDGDLGFPNQFVGATVDSEMTSRPWAFRYEREDKRPLV